MNYQNGAFQLLKKGIKVSDLFVKLVIQLVEGKRPSQDEIHLLSPTELHLFN